MEFPILIIWTGPVHFHFKGCLVVFVFFYCNFDRTFCKQTLETRIKCCILQHLIWICTDCPCPTKGMLGLKILICFLQRHCLSMSHKKDPRLKDPDLCSMASDLGLHSLPMSHKKDTCHIWVKSAHAHICTH